MEVSVNSNKIKEAHLFTKKFCANICTFIGVIHYCYPLEEMRESHKSRSGLHLTNYLLIISQHKRNMYKTSEGVI